MSIQIFCDFDGTITNNDNIMSIMEKFAPPEAEEVKNRILSQELSIQEGVSQLFQFIPTNLHDEIIQFLIETAEIRNGFHEFIQFVNKNNISFYVISGGMDFFVYPLLQGIIPKEQIYCNETDFSSEFIAVKWPHPCDHHCQNHCGLCKSSLIRKLSNTNDFHIVIEIQLLIYKLRNKRIKCSLVISLLQNVRKIIFLIHHLKRFTMFKLN